MKKVTAILVLALLLCGCSGKNDNRGYDSRFTSETVIVLSDDGITVNGGPETEGVYTSRDIIYHEDRLTYDSGNPYGEAEDWERHTKEEADAHTVVNITAPGAYRVTGTLSAGQIRIDLGERAKEDSLAVVELVLDGADITCQVAPAILFQNVYECDGDWSVETAGPEVDTELAGANLILLGENKVSGSHVARIYKDKEGQKKLWKQDGAIYSYMSMNVDGSGALELIADNEGLDTELHLTINGGDLVIHARNDGINTNEDGVSVTTINAGTVRIMAGLGEEGDGIDSNGYLVINGGTVIASAKPVSDAGLDSDMGSFIHGGTVIALGAAMDWAESDSEQVAMNLQFAEGQVPVIEIANKKGETVKKEEIVFSFDPETDPVLGSYGKDWRQYRGMILSCPELKVGETYILKVDGQVMGYTGTDLGGPGGMGGFPGGRKPPEGEAPPQMPEGDGPPQMPEEMEMPGRPGDGEPPEGAGPPEGMQPPAGFDGKFPEGPGGNPGGSGQPLQTGFYMNDKVNAFSGIRKSS